MTFPAHLAPQTLVVIRPVSTTDSHGTKVFNYSTGATRTTITGWLWQRQRDEANTADRDLIEETWTLMSSATDIEPNDRIEWSGHPSGDTLTFLVWGPPAPLYVPSGAVHHTETTLRRQTG